MIDIDCHIDECSGGKAQLRIISDTEQRWADVRANRNILFLADVGNSEAKLSEICGQP